MTNGIFLINKPVGVTSHDVVDRIRKVTGEKKVGHAGTLDPLAEGLLIVAVGREYTKRLSGFVGLDKEYEAEIKLGAKSTTYDAEGEITKTSDKIPVKNQVEKCVDSFRGEYKQTPPIFSAKKVKGKKAYELARKGVELKLEPKLVKIYEIKLMDYNYPKLKLKTKVSSGTYIRSLAHDIGRCLKVGAHLDGLTRTKIGNYNTKQAVNLEDINTTRNLMSIV